MRKFLLSAALLAVLSSCNTVPEEPNFVLTLNGNYKAIADCATAPLRSSMEWLRIDLDTLHRVEFRFEYSYSKAGLITLEQGPGDTTRITSKIQRSIYGKDYWENTYRPIFQQCAAH